MNTVLLLPRLPLIHACNLLEEFKENPPNPVRTLHELQNFDDRITYAPSGGHRSPETALEVADNLRRIAMGVGFPAEKAKGVKTYFDKEATKFLADSPAFKSGEALRDDVWACLTFIFLPDLVSWRFEGYPRGRYFGGVRNAFQRLWTRGVVLDRGKGSHGRWQLVDHLSEDAMVQIFERSSISGNPRLAQQIAEAWLKTREHVPSGDMENVMRRAMKIIRLKNEVYSYPVLSADSLFDEFLRVFSKVSSEVDIKKNDASRHAGSQAEGEEPSAEAGSRSFFSRMKKRFTGR